MQKITAGLRSAVSICRFRLLVTNCFEKQKLEIDDLNSCRCNEFGNWDNLPVCMASSCPPLPEVPNAVAKFLNGAGRNYGTVVRFDCEPGFRRSGKTE